MRSRIGIYCAVISMVLILIGPMMGDAIFGQGDLETNFYRELSTPFQNGFDNSDTSFTESSLSDHYPGAYVNEYKDGGFNPGDNNRNRIEDILEESVENYPEDRLIECYVLLSCDDGRFDISSLEEAGAEILQVLSYIDQIHVRIPSGSITMIANLPDVAEICYIPMLEKCLDTSVPSIALSDVYSMGMTGQGTTIAILDTGIDGNHECFPGGKILAFKDYTTWPPQTTTAYDDDGHGTHCASIAAGNPPAGGASGGRYKGVAYNANLLIARVMGATVMGYVVNAVDWVVANRNVYNVQVMSLSIGTVNEHGLPSHSDSMNSACNDAIGYGIVVCAAAGNDGEEGYAMGSPADAANVVTVGSCNDYGALSSFSTRGPGANGAIKPDVLAPGEYIRAARASGTNMGGAGWDNGVVDPTHYVGAQGTSMSCPHVAGVAAILREANMDTSPGDIRTALRESAPFAGSPNNQRGCGMVNAREALELIGNSPKITSIKVDGTNAIGNIPNINEDVIVTFSTTATDDKPLPASSFVWDFDTGVDSNDDGDKLNDRDLVGQSGPHTYTTKGLKTVVLTVTDSDNFKNVEYCYINVTNVVPTGDILVSGAVDEGVEVEITCTLSDSQSDMASLKWYLDFDGDMDTPYDGANLWSGDGITDNDRMIYGTGSSPSGKHTYLDSGQKEVILFVWDDDLDENAIKKVITVRNQEPTAILKLAASMDPALLFEDEPVIFDGSYSTDTENDIDTLEYRWDFGDFKDSGWQSDPAISHSYAQQGMYVVTLKVRDNDRDDDTTTMDVIVQNKGPIAVIDEYNRDHFEGDIVPLIGNNSLDTPGDIDSLEYYWDLDAMTDMEDDRDSSTWWDDDGIPDNDRQLEGDVEEFPYENHGTYSIALIVVDNDGAYNNVHKEIVIKNSLPGDLELVAVYKGGQYTESFEVEEGVNVDFQGSATDIEGDMGILNFSWNFGEGTPAFGRNVAHPFMISRGEAYIVQLIVMDDDHNDSAVKSLSIYVKNLEPTLELGDDQLLKGNGSLLLEPVVGDSAKDLRDMEYRWCVVDADQEPDYTEPTSTEKTLSYEFEIDGDYEIYLRIEDDNGARTTDHVSVLAKNINPDADYDGDRMPNGYEIRMNFDPRVQNGNEDDDNDGYTNLREYLEGTDPRDDSDYPREEQKGVKGKVWDYAKRVDPFIWAVIVGVVLILITLLIVVKIVRRRRERENLAKVFRMESTVDRVEARIAGKGSGKKRDYDYLGAEMGLRSKEQKTRKHSYEDLYVEKRVSREGSRPDRGRKFDEEDMAYFDDVSDERHGPQEDFSDLPDLAGDDDHLREYALAPDPIDHPRMEEKAPMTEVDEPGEFLLPGEKGDSGTEAEVFWPSLEPVVEKETAQEDGLDDLFSLPELKKMETQKGMMKTVSKPTMRPLMKTVTSKKVSMKPLQKTSNNDEATMDRKVTTMRPVPAEKVPRSDGGIFHDDTAMVDRIIERPFRVEVILPEEQDEAMEETGVELNFKPPSSYRKRSKKPTPDSSPVCRHCAAPVKKGWWMCPKCNKKL